MRIAIDGHRVLSAPETSGGVYLRTLLEEWMAGDEAPEIELLLPDAPVPGWAEKWIPDDPRILLSVANRPVFPLETFRAQVAWQQIGIPRLLAASPPDLYFSPFHLTPQLPVGQKVATAIHDLCFLTEPRFSRSALIQSAQVLSACTRASRLICVSRFTMEMLARWSPRAATRAVLVHNGLTRRRLGAEEARALVHDVAPILEADRYLMWIGKPSRRKNMDLLFSVFGEFHRRAPDFHFVVVAPFVDHPELVARGQANGLDDRLVLRAGVSEKVRDALYRQAKALVFPSHCEGFGYPILEAMIQGCPAISFADSPAREMVEGILPLAKEATTESVMAALAAYLELPAEEQTEIQDRLVSRSAEFSSGKMGAKTLAALLSALD
jgi:glycosyltransferase involved in cell wall biosynthesis